MNRYNELQRNLLSHKIPNVFICGNKNKLKEIGKNIKELQDDWLKWNAIAEDFLKAPNYIFEYSDTSGISFIHFNNLLMHRINIMESCITQIINNYNKIYSHVENKINFLIAITGWIITLLALIIAVIQITSIK